MIDKFFQALKKEFLYYKSNYNLSRIKTIYFGGGNPAFNLNLLEQVISLCEDNIDLSFLQEWTIEANPININNDLVTLINSSRVNRISLGVQSFTDYAIEYANRLKQTGDILYDVFDLLKLNNINTSIDLICALPYSNLATDMANLNMVLSRYDNINHISFYDLSIDEGSQFYKLDNLKLFSESELYEYEAKMKEIILKNNFYKYEISNFSRNGKKSLHNLAYWKYKNYIGLGPSAHSTIDNVRIENFPDINAYIEANAFSNKVNLTLQEQIEEFLLMGLRLNEGISRKAFLEFSGIDLFDVLSDIDIKYRKRIILTGDNIHITTDGMNILNTILVELFISVEKIISRA